MVAFHRFANAYIPIERVNAMLVLVIEALFDSIAARLPSTAVVKVGYFALNKRSIPLVPEHVLLSRFCSMCQR